MPFHNIRHATDETPVETSDAWSHLQTPATAMLVSGGVAAIIGCGWYYYKYHHVSFGGKTWFDCNGATSTKKEE